jgi:hypothetical protein
MEFVMYFSYWNIFFVHTPKQDWNLLEWGRALCIHIELANKITLEEPTASLFKVEVTSTLKMEVLSSPGILIAIYTAS